MKFEAIEAKPWHCGALARRLRSEHRDLLDDMKVPTHRQLRETFDASSLCQAWTLGGELHALAGVTGSSASAEGMLWLAMTDEAMRHPFGVARGALRFIDAIMQTKRRISIMVLADDMAGVRLAYFLGFWTDGRETIKGRQVILMSNSNRKAA
jgi:hypothetical protein